MSRMFRSFDDSLNDIIVFGGANHIFNYTDCISKLSNVDITQRFVAGNKYKRLQCLEVKEFEPFGINIIDNLEKINELVIE